MKSLLCFLFIAISLIANAKSNVATYKKIDSLISTGSIINNMNALNLLNSECINDTITSNYWILHSLACFNSYKEKESLTSINKAISTDNKNHKAYYEKARFIMDIEKDKTKAISILDTAINLKKDGEYFFYRGIYHQMSDSTSKAIGDYEAAIKLNYKHSGLFRNYSILLLNADMPQKALKLVNMGIEYDSLVAENYNTRGDINVLLANPYKACSDYNKAIELGYRKQSSLRKAICTNTYNENKHALVGDALVNIEKYFFAINAYSKAIEEVKDSSRYYLNRGYCYFMEKEYNKAEQDYLKALSLPTPLLRELYDNLSLLYYNKEDYVKSIEYSTKLIELNPNNQVPYIDRGLCYRKLKEYEKSENDFNKSLELKPDFFRAFGYRAFLYLETGNTEKALKDAIKSVEINPEYAYGYLVLGETKVALKIDDFCIEFMNAKKYGNEEADKAIKIYCE